MTPPVAGADLRAALVASCFLGALPPVDFLAVCLVLAIFEVVWLLVGRDEGALYDGSRLVIFVQKICLEKNEKVV